MNKGLTIRIGTSRQPPRKRVVIILLLVLLPITAAWLLAVSLTGAAEGAAGVRYVGSGAQCGGREPCYATIQGAVGASSPGDSIIVLAGTYNENVDVDKADLTIRSEDGPADTIVRALDPEDYVFDVLTDVISIIGFNITGATWCPTEAAGIRIYYDYTTIADNIITGNCDGIFMTGDHVTITGNEISDNNSGPGSDGIYMAFSNHITITDNTIANNGDEGIQLELKGMHFLIKGNAIRNNGGDGIFLGTRASDWPGGWSAGLGFSHHYRIENNQLIGNGSDGIDLGQMPVAAIVHGNVISGNASHGLTFGGASITYYERGHPFATVMSERNRIQRNNFLDNGEAGLRMFIAQGNRVYLNNFSGNTPNASVERYNAPGIYEPPNIYHSGAISYTYQGQSLEGTLGNYWEDYDFDGADPDGDGVGEPAYVIRDLLPTERDNRPLMAPFESYFDAEPPTVVSVKPADGATTVQADEPIEVIFNEVIDSSSLVFLLMPDPGGIEFAWNQEGTVLTVLHNSFAFDTQYKATVETAEDLAGNEIDSPYNWSFKILKEGEKPEEHIYLPMIVMQ